MEIKIKLIKMYVGYELCYFEEVDWRYICVLKSKSPLHEWVPGSGNYNLEIKVDAKGEFMFKNHSLYYCGRKQLDLCWVQYDNMFKNKGVAGKRLSFKLERIC